MDYSKLTFKEKFLNTYLQDNDKTYFLTDDLAENSKKYIYNRITKNVFDIFLDEPMISIAEVAMSMPVTQREIEIIEIKNVKVEQNDVLEDATFDEQGAVIEPVPVKKPKAKRKYTKKSK